MPASATALWCCVLRLDFSMWPLRVAAGNTHPSNSVPRLIESNALRVDALAKVILSSPPDTNEDTRKAAVSRGELRYARFLESVGANMAGDAQAALSERESLAPARLTLRFDFRSRFRRGRHSDGMGRTAG
jgi:hypothetical protein